MGTPMRYLLQVFPAGSGDPVGSNSEYPRRVDMFQASTDTGGGHRVSLTRRHRLAPGARARARTGPVAGSVLGARWHRAAGAVCYAMVLLLASVGRHNTDSKGPRARAEYSSGSGSVARSGVVDPESDQLVWSARGPRRRTSDQLDGGRLAQFLGKGSIVTGEVLSRSTNRVSIVVRSWSTTENIGPTHGGRSAQFLRKGSVVAEEVLPGSTQRVRDTRLPARW
ncbi:hypothetical protein TIFTF001_001749 [Ficus carica]|uniref:Uncharacterized protein n=1 Tax=Ficus carica TaxID=3494 RepID=A0AA88D5K1_FICCA|nr:hypothetical protein TIFTF001_001749 [Ficus carica]